ncbi:phosphomannomutase [Thiohalobacter thiocyanaticus]|uniref:Phosphomannomutase n=1 Tax=Thiohalobacter thiocyanaticus TaxID=585455 RepID=A0A426QIQ7_9GAMM|nr:phosphomannomutase [Thiohalobacter thiocyanaticus]RRQ21654.1 phosphomannomutase [Thiohalobacter thiocyanaticus]
MSAVEYRISDLMQQSGVGFGTSGARGRVADMTPPVCYAYTRAFLQHLESSQGLPPGSRVAIAGDLRPSTPDIMAAVARACVDAGHQPVNCGLIPSPAVALYGIEQNIPAIMVTGSHIPDDRNGIKFNKLGGEILKDDELAIRAQTVTVPEPFPADYAAALPAVDATAAQRYLQRYLDFFPRQALQGLKVGVYEHSGVGRDLLAAVLERLGADITRLNRSEVFIPVDTEAIRPEDVELARGWAGELKLDAIVSTDGDADRPLIADATGSWLRGDIVGVLCAQALGIDRLATPVSSNTVVEKCGSFERVERTRIGSPYVITGMQTLAEGGGASVAGYEANGGFLLATPVRRDGRELAALPTRDAFIVILAVLAAAREQGSVSALAAALPPRYTYSDRIKAFPTEQSARILAELDGSQAKLDAIFGKIAQSRLIELDSTDGLRLTFDNQEIIHLRPSGNAPELRCYNEAGSAGRAEALNRDCMALLAGWREKQPPPP